jgi:uncharacterized membrane protein
MASAIADLRIAFVGSTIEPFCRRGEMARKRTFAALAVATMGLFGADRAMASEPEAIGGAERVFDFSVCNRTRAETSVAISARLAPDSKEFVVAGWWKVAAGACRKIGSYPRGHFYMHAQSGRTTWGKGDIAL